MLDVSAQTVLELDGHSLRLADLPGISQGRYRFRLGPEVQARLEASRRVVEDILSNGRVAYGINTGFGRLSSVRILPDQLQQLQRNLVRSHAAGVGPRLEDSVVRVLMVLRINSLIQGHSGVRPALIEALLRMVEHDILPVVPSRGSVGASGDLAPLSHVALALMGEGDVRLQGATLPAAQALAQFGLEGFSFEAKEALALINGTQLMCAVGGLALERAHSVLKAADLIGAMSLEALLGTDTALHPDIHRVRLHPGQQSTATNQRRTLRGSQLVESHKDCEKVQDAYSIRCMPQVHGAAREGWRFASQILEREINAVTDNPLVFPEGNLIISGGNFHGAPVALALDCAAVALSYLGTISERRTDRLLNPDTSELPPFLSRGHGLNSGLMLTQYVAAALASENKILCHPASADSIPTSAGHEDHVSMGPAAAYKLERLLDHLEQILACEWVCAAQALEFHRPLKFGPGTEAALACLRRKVEPVVEDRALHADLTAARDLIADGSLVGDVEAVLGQLD